MLETTLSSFGIGQLPHIDFGPGRLQSLPDAILTYGRRVLLVLGGQSFCEGPHWSVLQKKLEEKDIHYAVVHVRGEPSPSLVDEIVQQHQDQSMDVVVGLGGGSVMDAAKAVAGLLPSARSVLDFLEDVGRGMSYQGPSLPFIAIPTTAGTGSEATKNAVLSEHGAGGFKKSFRHDCMVARLAIVDPQLLESCPQHLMAAQGMDAFTQLLESFVSLRANPLTDALAWSGLERVAEGFLAACEGGDTEAAQRGRAAMAYGALLSGITLAQVGLGSVHGLAQPLGSLFPVPHGLACGATLAAATRVNIQALAERDPESPALLKYARVGRLLAKDSQLDDEQAQQQLLEALNAWRAQLQIPGLADYGIGEADIPAIVTQSRGNSMKSNPVELSDEEIATIVRLSL